MNSDNCKRLRQKRDTIIAVLQEVASLIEGSPSTAASHWSKDTERGFPELTSEAASLKNYSQALQRGVFTLALLGEALHLKGCLGGALLGNRMLANRYIPVPVMLDYGQQVDVAIYEAERPRMVAWKDFIDEIEKSSNNAARIHYVQMERQLPWLAKGIRLIDFPNLREMQRRRNSVNNLLKQSDACVLVLDVEHPLVEDIVSLIKTATEAKLLNNLFFVIASSGQITAATETNKKKLQQLLQKYFLDEQGNFDRNCYNSRVFFVDVQAALAMRIVPKQDVEKLAASGLTALEEAIAQYVTANERIAQKLEPTLKVLRSTVLKGLTSIAHEKAQLSQQQQKEHFSHARALQHLEAMEKQLTELVRKANTTVYDQSKAARRQKEPHATVKPTEQTRSQVRRHDEPDPLRVWIDAEDHLQFALHVVKRPDIPTYISTEIEERIEQIRRREADPHLYMAIVGEFSSGKSTFINALLREELLAVSVLPTTAVETQFRYGPELDVTIAFKALPEPLSYRKQSALIWQRLRSISPELPRSPADLHTCLQLVTADETMAAHVSRVVIIHAAPFLEDGIVIIDTPGVNALNEQHTQVTRDLIERDADGAVIMIPAPIPLARSLTDFLATQLKPFLHRCLFVVTQMDRIREREQRTVVENIRKRLTDVLGLDRPVILYECAAQAVLDALEGDDVLPASAHWSERFAELEELFFDRLRRERMLSIAESLLRLLDRLFVRLDEYLYHRRSDYEQRQAALESNRIQDLASFTHEQQRIYQDRLADFVAQARTRVEHCIKKQKETTKKDIRTALFNASDTNALQQVLTSQVSDILETSDKAIIKELRKSLTELSTTAELVGQAFDEEFTKEYRRLRAVSGLLVANNRTITNRDLQIEVSDILSSAQQRNRQHDEQEGWSIGGGAVGGAVLGTAILPGIGTVIGLIAGGIVGSLFGPSLDKRKTDLWEQLEPKLDRGFEDIREAAKNKVEAYARELEAALDKRINTYIARYKTTVDSMIRNQQSELQELHRLQRGIEQDRKEINRRRSILQQKRKELAMKIV